MRRFYPKHKQIHRKHSGLVAVLRRVNDLRVLGLLVVFFDDGLDAARTDEIELGVHEAGLLGVVVALERLLHLLVELLGLDVLGGGHLVLALLEELGELDGELVGVAVADVGALGVAPGGELICARVS